MSISIYAPSSGIDLCTIFHFHEDVQIDFFKQTLPEMVLESVMQEALELDIVARFLDIIQMFLFSLPHRYFQRE